MIRQSGELFVLHTRNTTYCFRIMETGHLQHIYYGSGITVKDEKEAEALYDKHILPPGSTNVYDQEHPQYSLEDVRLEMSSYGKSDIREPFIEVIHADGSYTSDFLFDHAVIREGRKEFETLPGSYEEEGKVDELVVTLKDAGYDLTLELHYFVFEDRDVITRSAKFINTSRERIQLLRLMSTQLDFETDDFTLSTFNGCWGREMERHDVPVRAGKIVNASYTGGSSSRANPFVMLSKDNTSEEEGPCYGMNLIYSGNHYEAVEVNAYHKTRFVSGINPQSFRYLLDAGDSFEAPEAVMVFSPDGFNGMSQRMHGFVRDCICRGKWKKKVRPVLLNSWEACYFDIDESKLLKLAEAGKEVGIELFVMDDGWFGERNDDRSSLGDWKVNRAKLPNGLKGLVDKVNDLGLDFGIWVEPEMVNTDSSLYRAHPDWTLAIPGKAHTEGRNQRILDLCNPACEEYIINAMRELFASANIAYVKWDMNRIFSDYYSPYLAPERQGEVAHRYIVALYRILGTLTSEFPDILFEGCASGGNRFDLGILSYFPQIWASDDTDALYRVNGQTGYSYGYPMSTVSAHVSVCPNHQTLRTTPLSTRFNVAAFGICGYECDLRSMEEEDINEMRNQIEVYKQWREVLQFGHFYRGRNGNVHEWTTVSRDRKKAVGMLMQELVQPNTLYEQYKPKGLDREKKYTIKDRILRSRTQDTQSECYTASGDAMMNSGVKLTLGLGTAGYREELRYHQDFGSRIFFMEESKETGE